MGLRIGMMQGALEQANQMGPSGIDIPSEEEFDAIQRAQVKQAIREIRQRDVQRELQTILRERQAEIEDELAGLDAGPQRPGKQRKRSNTGINRGAQNDVMTALDQRALGAQGIPLEQLVALGGQPLPL